MNPRATMAKAFRETALSLVGLFQIYDSEPELAIATAEALGSVFRRHLRKVSAQEMESAMNPLCSLADEMERVVDRDRKRER